MIFTNQEKVEPIEVPLNWHAEYTDGTSISEYDVVTKQKNDFYSIDQDHIARFGLFGVGQKYFFEMSDGAFNLGGKRITVEYHTKDGKIIRLTSNANKKDLITFKQAYANFSNVQGVQRSFIESFNFGYKTALEKESYKLHFQPVVVLPNSKELPFIQVRITSDKDLEGELVFKRGRNIVDRFNAPIAANHTGQLNWTIKF